MHIVLSTPQGSSLINIVKTNSIDLIVNKIVVSFTSEKSPDLVFVYEDIATAKKAYERFINNIHWRET